MKSVFKSPTSLLAAMCCLCLMLSGVVMANDPLQPRLLQLQPSPEQPDPNVQDYTKTIKREFPISVDGTVNLINKYGRVDVKTWDKGRAKIEVNIVVKAGNEAQAQAVFNRIHIDFANNDSFVKAETTIEPNKTGWFNFGDSGNSEFQINYLVHMPASASLDLTNRYGDATVAPLLGKAKVDVKYGNFKLDGIGAGLNVNLDYGNGTVARANDANVNVSYSTLNLNEVRNVVLTSKYSKFTVDNGASLTADSRYDEFTLTNLGKLSCTAKYGNLVVGKAEVIAIDGQYTDLKVDRLKTTGDFDLQYGGLRINNVSKGFTKINLVGKHSDFKIGVEDGANYTLDASANFAGIAYPDRLVVTYEQEKGTSHQVKGHTGQGARSSIQAELNYGGLKVKQ